MGVFTEEEVAALAHPGILLEEGRVTVTGRADWTWVLILPCSYCIAVLVLLRAGLGDFSPLPSGLFLLATVLFALGAARFRVVSVFNPFEKAVLRRNLIHRMADIPFPDIAGVVPVEAMGRVFFKISLKANPLGRGYRITRHYKSDEEEYGYFLFKALPAIADMLEEYRETDREARLALLAESPFLFARDGARYTFTSWSTHLLTFCFGLFMLLVYAGIEDWTRWIGLVAGCLAMLALLVMHHKVTIDREAGTISFCNPLGIFTTRFSLHRYAGIRVVREHTNGIYTHTLANVAFQDPQASALLHWGVGTRKLSALVEETEAIIHSITGKDAPG